MADTPTPSAPVEPSPDALTFARELSHHPYDFVELARVLDTFAAQARAAAFRECLDLADTMTNQRDLIRDLMKRAGVEKFESRPKCLLCRKNARAEDGGMLCLECRHVIDGCALSPPTGDST